MPRVARHAATTVLTALGFSAEVDDLYHLVRGQSGRGLSRVAASMLRTPDELLADLAPLVDAGIVRVQDDTIVVEPPAEALRMVVSAQSALVDGARRSLDGIHQAIALLASDEARRVAAGANASVPLDGEMATGGDIFSLVRSLIGHGTGELLWLRPEQWRGPREARMVAMVQEAIRAGRTSRALYPVRALHDNPAAIAARAAIGEQVRVLPELPTRLLVVGDTHAVVPEPLGYADVPLSIVRQRGLVEAMRRWFEMLWERAAVPSLGAARVERAQPQADLRRFLLEQLATGAHDEQIARKLGISLRTVRRRVADLMSELGADSRFQAGVEAVRRGWL